MKQIIAALFAVSLMGCASHPNLNSNVSTVFGLQILFSPNAVASGQSPLKVQAGIIRDEWMSTTLSTNGPIYAPKAATGTFADQRGWNSAEVHRTLILGDAVQPPTNFWQQGDSQFQGTLSPVTVIPSATKTNK